MTRFFECALCERFTLDWRVCEECQEFVCKSCWDTHWETSHADILAEGQIKGTG